LLAQPVSQLFCPRFALRQVNAFVAQFLRLCFVSSFRLGKVGAEFLHFLFVSSLRLFEELALEMLDLRNPFRNESI
jgi:hypothetical protein